MFKLHFYIISVVLIISLLNCFYGFARMIRLGNHTRKRALLIQTATSLFFLECVSGNVLRRFTYRTGEITVSAISAVLMVVFFALSGITVGIFAGSFLLGRNGRLSILLSAVLSVAATLAMYVGEMILLRGNLYRFGAGGLDFLYCGLVSFD